MTVLYPYLCYKKVCRGCTLVLNLDGKDSDQAVGGKGLHFLLQLSEKWSNHIWHVDDKICFTRCNFGCRLGPFIYKSIPWGAQWLSL